MVIYLVGRNNSNERFWIEDYSKARYLKSMNLTSEPACAVGWTTCSSGTGSMCCPYENGTCCGTSLTCCSEGYKCSDDGMACLKA
jgi:Granulin